MFVHEGECDFISLVDTQLVKKKKKYRFSCQWL